MSGPMQRALRFANFVAMAVLLTALFLTAIQGQSAGNAANITAAKATFRAKCAMCHGPDGAGSEVGKSMNVPDLRSLVIRKAPDTQLAEVIANGKNGMPPFKGSLNASQIHDLVAYVRTFAAKK